MAYNENTWADGDLITASGMNNMEGGIKRNDTAIGDLYYLQTTAKSNLVSAINEVVAEVSGVDALLGSGVIE